MTTERKRKWDVVGDAPAPPIVSPLVAHPAAPSLLAGLSGLTFPPFVTFNNVPQPQQPAAPLADVVRLAQEAARAAAGKFQQQQEAPTQAKPLFEISREVGINDTSTDVRMHLLKKGPESTPCLRHDNH